MKNISILPDTGALEEPPTKISVLEAIENDTSIRVDINNSPRRAVLEVTSRLGRPFSVKEILPSVRALLPGVGRSTVYRTLAWLEDRGEMRRIVLHSGDYVFAPAVNGFTGVFECSVCGGVQSFTDSALATQMRSLAERRGFSVGKTECVLHGRCSDCASASVAE